MSISGMGRMERVGINDKEEPNGIKRHLLLHGRSQYDINEIDCIKLFNAVHSISVITDIANKEQKEVD